MLQLQNVILEMIASEMPLEQIGERLCREVETLLSGVICSVLLVDRAGILHPLAGPSLPADYSASVEGAEIGPQAGSCGTAAYRRAPVVVSDIETDPLWAAFKHLALPIGLRACWSSPILDARGAAIGTFAFYYRECRGPTALEQSVVKHCVHLCAIAIERDLRFIEHCRRATTDGLTGLPNRAAFNTALASLNCDIPGNWALFVLDVDNLKVVNDTFGHLAGDRLLKAVSDRISSIIPSGRMFRIGGDEFAIILESTAEPLDLDDMAEQIIATLMAPADCGGQNVIPRATIGGAMLSAGDATTEQVRQNADFALYHAKDTGRGGFVRYQPGLRTKITRRLNAIRDVGIALLEHRIDAYYQPIMRLDTGEVVGLEALCRMRVGDEIVAAMAFHEATTDAHIATELTARMMTLVAADVRTWLDLGIPFQHVGINVSSADMHGDTIDRVLITAFERKAVPLKHVILEVTESVYMDRMVQRAVEGLRARGLRIALDDFGTGFASLTHLLTVPVDIIKIDKTFIDRVALDGASLAIVEGLIRIADKLNIRVVAEGIETEDQAQQLRAIGCSMGQGYLFSPAIDRYATTALLMNRAQYSKEALVPRVASAR